MNYLLFLLFINFVIGFKMKLICLHMYMFLV